MTNHRTLVHVIGGGLRANGADNAMVPSAPLAAVRPGACERGPEPRTLLPMSARARLRSETAGLKPSPILP